MDLSLRGVNLSTYFGGYSLQTFCRVLEILPCEYESVQDIVRKLPPSHAKDM